MRLLRELLPTKFFLHSGHCFILLLPQVGLTIQTVCLFTKRLLPPQSAISFISIIRSAQNGDQCTGAIRRQKTSSYGSRNQLHSHQTHLLTAPAVFPELRLMSTASR